MTVTLELTPDMAHKLHEVAQGRTSDAPAIVRELLTQMPPLLAEAQISAKPPRIAGLQRGSVLWISEDFDDPLPDSFWFGEDAPVFPEVGGKI